MSQPNDALTLAMIQTLLRASDSLSDSTAGSGFMEAIGPDGTIYEEQLKQQGLIQRLVIGVIVGAFDDARFNLDGRPLPSAQADLDDVIQGARAQVEHDLEHMAVELQDVSRSLY